MRYFREKKLIHVPEVMLQKGEFCRKRMRTELTWTARKKKEGENLRLPEDTNLNKCQLSKGWHWSATKLGREKSPHKLSLREKRSFDRRGREKKGTRALSRPGPGRRPFAGGGRPDWEGGRFSIVEWELAIDIWREFASTRFPCWT